MKPLARDERGMILIIAIPMGALLVGMLWYLASVGDAVLFRERLQDAADSTAFENAVLHARGMNAVAMMNILMSLLLSVIVALRAAEIVLAAGLVFFGVTAEPLATVIDLDVQASPKVAKAIGIMNKLEKGIAAATPVMASVLASGGNTSFYRAHEAASASLALSYALMPTLIDDKSRVDANDRAFLQFGGGGGSTQRMGSTLVGSSAGRAMPSLPVEDGSYDQLCAKAMEFGVKQIAELASRFGAPHKVMSMIEKMLGIFDGLLKKSHITSVFCLTGADSLKAVVDKACDDSDLPDDPPADDDQSATPTSGKYGSDPKRTKKEAKKEVDTCSGKFEKATQAAEDESSVQLPARMWARAENGNVIMQSWSLATSKGPKYAEIDKRGMGMASPNNQPDYGIDKVATAQAEYYYGCGSGWNGCKEDATWALGWTARMRRFWWPLAAVQKTSGAFYAFEDAFSQVEGFIERGLADVGAGTNVEQLGEDADAALRARNVYRSLTGTKPKVVH